MNEINDRHRVALGLRPSTVDGWIFWCRYWAPRPVRGFAAVAAAIVAIVVVVVVPLWLLTVWGTP